MSLKLVRQNGYTQIEPAKLVLQEYGTFTIFPRNQTQLLVKSVDGLLVDSVLYPFSAYMQKHTTGWRFVSDSINIPKLAPKKKQEALEKLTDRINTYMDEHQDMMDVLDVQAWEVRARVLDDGIRRMQADLVQQQTSLVDYQRRIEEEQAVLAAYEKERAEHWEKKPDEAVGPGEQEAS